MARIFNDYPLMVPFQNMARDAALVASKMDNHLLDQGFSAPIDRIEMACSVFIGG